MNAGNKSKVQRKLNVLLLTKQDFTNPRDGGTMRANAVYQELISREINVTTVAVESSGEGARNRRERVAPKNIGAKIRVLCSYAQIGSLSSARWFRGSTVDRIINEATKTDFDCVVIEYTQLMGYLPLFDAPPVLDMHNIESELLLNYSKSSKSVFRRVIAGYEAWRMSLLENRLPLMVQVLSAVSKHDADIAANWSNERKGTKAKIILAANGVSDAGFSLEGKRENDVVFVAHLGWQPNVDAARWLAQEVWPLVMLRRPELKLRLIGRAPADEVLALEGPGISVHGDVASVVEYVAAARVATAPLLAAGGTRLKILEALSCGTPVVATSLGALGLESLEGSSLAVADSASRFAEEIVRLAALDSARSLHRDLVQPFRWPITLKQLGDEVETLGRTRHRFSEGADAGQPPPAVPAAHRAAE